MATDDMELVREYAARQSETAFAALVSRHANLVYSAGLRLVRDPQLAEEITQVVFIILARKAGSLNEKTILPGWLYRAACHTARNALKREYRRQRREQEACMQSTLDETGTAETWKQMSPLLEEAMLRLNQADRDALVLRFFEGRSLNEVGIALGATEDAAKKRVSRALEKLRIFFTKRGVTSTTAVIAMAISANSVHAAPVGLAATATAAALTKGAAVGSSTVTLAKATLIAMKIKIIVATITATLVIGTGMYFLIHAKLRSRSAHGDIVPIKLANEGFAATPDDRFVIDVDANTRRTTDSPPAGHIKSVADSTSSSVADYLASTTGSNSRFAGIKSVRYVVDDNSSLLGKRIDVKGWMKTRDVRNWAGATLLVIGYDGHIYSDDDMTSRPVQGTTDWQQIEFVTDMPKEPCVIYFAPALYGAGEVWLDDFQIDVAAPGTSITDDRIWHVWSPNPNDYSVTQDYNVTHDGHRSLCITYLPSGPAPKGSWMWWGEDIRDPDKYRGHTVRMTVWAKCENIADHVRPNLRPKGPNFKLLAQDKQTGGSPIRGTADWSQKNITCVIPKGTQCLDTGFAFHGSGRVWIDMDSLKYEIVK